MTSPVPLFPEPSIQELAREDRDYFNDLYGRDPDPDYDDAEAA